MSSLFKLRTVITLLVLLAVGYTGLWYTLGFQAQKDLTAELGQWRNSGMRVEHRSVQLSGFPYRIILSVPDLEVSTRGHGLTFSGDQLQLVSHIWTPQHWIAQISGAKISLADGLIAFEEDFIQASYRIHDNDKLVVKIDSSGADDLRILEPQNLPSLSTWTLAIGKDFSNSQATTGLYEKRTLEFRLFAAAPGGSIDMVGGISGPEVSDWDTRELEDWRDAGGLLEIDQFIWKTPETSATLSGDITLDEEMRLLGSGTLKVANWAGLKSLLAPLGLTVAAEGPDEASIMMQYGWIEVDGTRVGPAPAIKPQ